MRERWNVFVLLAALAAAVWLGVVAVNLADAQCGPGGCPNRSVGVNVWSGGRQPAPRVDVRVRTKLPTPAWRYERPEKHRAAVVRIYCQDNYRTRSIGSGVLVKWGGKLVVLTARHVIKDARKIIVETWRKKTHRATVLKVDATWDCAVLELTGTPEGVMPAEVELGQAAMPSEGVRLESCGYGGDDKLASNYGPFIGYRGSTQDSSAYDWLALAGYARGGDSGGPIFNEAGKVVAVMWGSNAATGVSKDTPRVAIVGGGDSPEVVGTQAGRLHVLLDSAVSNETADYNQQSVNVGRVLVFGGKRPQYFRQLADVRDIAALLEVETVAGIFGQPTPPKAAPLVPVPPQCGPNGCGPNQNCEQSGLTKKPMLPWRGGAEARSDSQQAAIDRLIELERMRQGRLDREAAQPPIVSLPPPAPPEAKAEEASPLLAGLCVLGGVVAGFVVYFSTQKSS